MRRSIDLAGLDFRGHPLPAAARIGNLVMSSGIAGQDITTGDVPANVQMQVVNMFENMMLIVEQAGGTIGDIIKCTFHVRDQSTREHINREWLRVFPEVDSRPARHTLHATLIGNVDVQCEFVAVLDGSATS